MNKSSPSQRDVVSDLKPKHQATLFPSLGYVDPKRGVARAFVHGRVFIAGKVPLGTRLLLKGLKRAMRASPDDYASETFQRRIDGFLAAPGRRRKIVLQISGRNYRLRRRTRRDGTFYGTLKLPESLTEHLLGGNDEQVIPMQLQRSTDSQGSIAATQGMIHFVPQRGISVISDIDDTIKTTVATDRREMLANTFLRPFETVEGMSELYKHWQELGCAFHYVSSSPWQLYEPLSELCLASEFPPGSMHLRYFKVRDEMLKKFKLIRQQTKVGIIARIFKRLPQRKFVLIGDSGEKDPEIYRFLAAKFPEKIAGILIRELPERPLAGKRRTKLKLDELSVPIVVFHSQAEISDFVEQIEV